MAASKRNAGVPSALAARQSLNDEELVGQHPLLQMTYLFLLSFGLKSNKSL